jgi:uncharacterized integral membrane protein
MSDTPPPLDATSRPAAADAGSDPSDGHGAARPPRPAGREAGRDIPWRLVALGVLLVYGILFVILNSKEVAVSFVFFTPKVSLIVALVLALLIGFLAGYLFDTMRDRRRRTPAASTPPKA